MRCVWRVVKMDNITQSASNILHASGTEVEVEDNQQKE